MEQKQYTIYHLHSDSSNPNTTIDSVTKYQQYVDRAKECGMKALGFSEHGVQFEWWNKKLAIEAAGMLYIHGVEAYMTETLSEKKRDNYHCVLIARNYDGFRELNRLISNARSREDSHFFYAPRITLNELEATSDNILVTTACIGGPLWKGSIAVKQRVIEFCAAHSERCFFEIQHHNDPVQVAANQYLYQLSQRFGVRLIAGTDTHALNDVHVRGRKILQVSKGIHFEDEDNWDLTFKTYDELVATYEAQNGLPREVYLQAIDNTNILLELVEPFEIECQTKYPKIYDDPINTFRQKINKAYKEHPYAKQRHGTAAIKARVHDEMEAYEKTGAVDFMLLETYMREWERKNGIHCGPGRGSVSGSMIAYLLHITEMDSMKFDLNFFRFINPDRVTNADIDTDYASKDRDRVKEFLLKEHMGLPQIQTCEIITFNTIAMKGAIKDVARALGMEDMKEVQTICDAVWIDEKKQQCIGDEWRKKYPELFEYVDIVNGTIVSIGTHPSGVLVSDRNIEEEIGLCTTSKSKYPVSMLNMKELDSQMWVKLDILGLDNVGLINETCRLLNISPITPDTVNLEDEAVWKSIRNDTTMIFQWESESAQSYLERFMSDATIAIARQRIKEFSYLKWMSFGNGLIRPACASFRDNVADGEFYDNGFEQLNQFLALEAGRIAMQETIMQFLVKFCGYSNAESDNVRRAIAKKKGTETLLPEIKSRFISYSSTHYNISKARCEEVIGPFIQVILDASAYAFSWNHSDSYSAVGYMCGYLRHYHPLEFLTAALNIFADNEEKTKSIVSYANKIGVTVSPIKFGHSGADYVFQDGKIYKGIASIKYMNKRIAKELLEVAQRRPNDFCDVLDLVSRTHVDSRQMEILIKLGFFEAFGDEHYLLRYVEVFSAVFGKKQLRADAVAGLQFTPETMTGLSEKVTAKTYSGFDNKCVIRMSMEQQKIEKTTMAERLAWECAHYGYLQTTLPQLNASYAFVQSYECKYKNPMVSLYRLKNGDVERVKVKRAAFDGNPFKVGDIIKTIELSQEGRWSKDAVGNWTQDNTNKEPILKKWSLVK